MVWLIRLGAMPTRALFGRHIRGNGLGGEEKAVPAPLGRVAH